jgi:hypothetical protein
VPPLPTPCPPPRVEQTQTQLEHARIGELEQSLLLEKAQAERLLRELADNRVTRPLPTWPPTRPPGRTPFAILCFYLLCLWPLSLLHFFLCAPFWREKGKSDTTLGRMTK